MYECISLYLFDKVIFMHGYKQHKFIRVINSSWIISTVHGTQNDIYIYIYIYMCVCVCVCVCVCKIDVRKL
jgi:hypothetical protein